MPPGDFSAWFEVYLGGAWHTFDARNNRRRIGRIVIARGRDATDVAISTSFATALLVSFEVFTDEVPEAGKAPVPVVEAKPAATPALDTKASPIAPGAVPPAAGLTKVA